MQANPLKEGTLTENSVGIGRVTRGMVRSRATELAVSNGRSSHEVSKSDWEQAKLSLTGTAAEDPTEAAIEAAPESDRGRARIGPLESGARLHGQQDTRRARRGRG